MSHKEISLYCFDCQKYEKEESICECGKAFVDLMTDPYGLLTFSVGNEDDFICFDYHVQEDGKVILHSVLNCETSSFIENFEHPAIYEAKEAVAVAIEMVDRAVEWCKENKVKHCQKGWGQDPYYFSRMVNYTVNKGKIPKSVVPNKKRIPLFRG